MLVIEKKRRSKYNFADRPCFQLFVNGIKSKDTRFVWTNYIHNFREQQGFTDYDQLLAEQPKMMQAKLLDYVQHKISKGSKGQTIGNHLTALKHFFWINEKDDGISWDRIKARLPEPERAVEDVPYTYAHIETVSFSNHHARHYSIVKRYSLHL